MSKIKVLVIDDSALMRRMVSEILTSDSEIEVVGMAADPIIARRKIKELEPDVLTLDVQMPRMDGLQFLRKLMALRPMPVVMISSLTKQGAAETLEALENGAIDVVAKPDIDLERNMSSLADEIIGKVKAAAQSKKKVVARPSASPSSAVPSLEVAKSPFSTRCKAVLIGSSTGGVEALRQILPSLPAEMPPVVIVQHMPPRFTESLAHRLDDICAMRVSEVTQSQRLEKGHIYIAQGGRHLKILRAGAHLDCVPDEGEAVLGHRPSVDVLFRSAIPVASGIVAVMLTGMGKDGADAMAGLRNAGARTIGQDSETSLVYGMPRAAFEAGGVERQVSLNKMAKAVVETCTADVFETSPEGSLRKSG